MTILTGVRPLLLPGAMLAALIGPSSASAQSQLDTAEATAFIGSWSLALETEMGPFVLDLDIADREGKVAAIVGSPEVGEQEVTDITRSGETLLLRYLYAMEGQVIPISLTLLPNGESLGAAVSVADGMFTANGSATRSD